ncbi:hypothetical protein RS130_00710 [Paraglaciecola aquimarina]|uniref:ParB/Sulfiredoxin domain-containing protein n=1 Tax=Paraglaciecola aquimarina TaxID=1235557 RepID=A0ABU3SRL5_9ALTE|nr:hypothetical protein [Paraglaciecola aquimarina]MDU0352632.1 hypothetical protein [Paraglaciecola aquimarina]
MATKRKLGINRAGTGKVTDDSGVDKWVSSIASHSESADKVKDVIAKSIPVDYILTDENNPRDLAIDSSLILKIVATHPCKTFVATEQDSEWIEPYVRQAAKAYNLDGKAIGDFQSLVEFAFSLKNAEAMLHPIVTWKDESTFHLMVGERRYLTHLLLQESHIYARIFLERPSQFQLDLLQWKENMDREEMTLFDRLLRIRKLIEALGGRKNVTVMQLSAIIGKSRSVAHRYMFVLEAKAESLLEYIKEGRVSDLKKAADLAKLSDPELKVKLGIERNKTVKEEPTRSSIKLSKSANTTAIEKLIRAAAKTLKIEDYVNEADFSNPKKTAEALNGIIDKISETN